MTDENLKRSYMAMKVTEFHRRTKLKAIEYKGGKCQVCGYDKSPAALVFHHRDPGLKDFTISGSTLKWENLQPELDKCDLLCSNCHIEEHERLAKVRYLALKEHVRQIVPERKPPQIINAPCFTCGKVTPHKECEIRSERLFCSTLCSSRAQERAPWPDKEGLEKLVSEHSLRRLAKMLGVSDVAVKKRCLKIGVSTPGRGYWVKRNHS